MFTVFTIFIKTNFNFKTIIELSNIFKPLFIIKKRNIKKLNAVINAKRTKKRTKIKIKTKLLNDAI